MTETPPAAGKPLPIQMLDLINGFWISKMIYAVAELQIADALRDGGRTAAELAQDAGVQPDRLYRLLRALAGVGLFVEDADGRFALTELGATLRTDRPDSMAGFARMMPASYNWRGWDELMLGIKEHKIPQEEVLGMTGFEYMKQHPEDERIFLQAMASVSGAENPAVSAAIDLAGVTSIVDVGGSGGHLLAAVLQQHGGVRGVLFDQPQVIEAARQAPYLQGDLAARVTFEGGDFFAAVPAGHDAYMMKYVLHDWNDDQCVQILTRCREAMNDGGRIFVVDNVIEAGNDPSWGKMLDINMLVCNGGSERTEEQFAAMFERAGLKLDRVTATACPLSIVTAVAN